MTSKELNKQLIYEFPKLKDAYTDEVSWQEGDDTGSHTVYGDVFTPHIRKTIENKDDEEIAKIFSYIENTLNMEDEYADEVISFSVLESIAELLKGEQWTDKFIKDRTKKILIEIG
ncbi:DUF7674 family protein [Listeria booriae]|uniref:DUF7674 domain-containing protein n=1 Tax=Listeria booriae TaxID=1552123 RepID=A0A7X0XZY7_9LIST|nr:hypothetical protein [Listeria booriae]MBC1794806.1 hypothetical protein [Listeria booriae]MBC1801830.1 hypothetical protein [Listeria booriae]MBC1804078.1 hypothetical protein [Listeria booriae]MBC2196115.1 hypothetical protein [Listeria booriae]